MTARIDLDKAVNVLRGPYNEAALDGLLRDEEEGFPAGRGSSGKKSGPSKKERKRRETQRRKQRKKR